MLFAKKKVFLGVLSLWVLFGFLCVFFTETSFAQKAPKGKVVIVHGGPFEGKGGDPHTAYGACGMQFLNTTFHEGLVKKREDGRIYPALAKSWQFAKDGLSITFTLNEKARFHNDEPVTAEDVRFSYERAKAPEMKYAGGGELRRLLNRIEVINDRQLTFHFKAVWASFLDRAIHLSIIPKRYTEKVGNEAFANKPIGAGPFRWVNGQQDIFFEVEAFEKHYRKVPNIKTLVFKNVQEHATRIAILKAGEADIGFIDWGSVGVVANDPQVKLQYLKHAYVRTISFFDLAYPHKPSPFHDIRVRNALSYAIDREAICKRILFNSSEPWGDVLAPYHLGYDSSIKPDPYDPAKAKALLTEAGYPNGFETVLTCNENTRPETEALSAGLRKVGIITKLNVPEEGIWARLISEKKLTGIGSMPGPWWAGYVHPAASLSQLKKEYSWTFVTTDEQDDAVKKLDGLIDPKEIAAQARKVSQLYREQRTRINLWSKHIVYGLGPKIKYWESVPGWMYPSLFEYLELKE